LRRKVKGGNDGKSVLFSGIIVRFLVVERFVKGKKLVKMDDGMCKISKANLVVKC